MIIGIRAEGHYQTILRKDITSASFGDSPIFHFDLVKCEECSVYGLNLQGTDFVCPLPDDPTSIEDAFIAIGEAIITFARAMYEIDSDS